MMEEALIARLKAAGTAAGTRFAFLERPQGSDLPSVTLQVVSPNQGGAAGRYHHGGVQNLLYPRVQFDFWGASPLQAKAIAREVTALLEQPADVDGVAFEDGLLDSESDETPEVLEGGRKIYRVRSDFLLPWRAI